MLAHLQDEANEYRSTMMRVARELLEAPDVTGVPRLGRPASLRARLRALEAPPRRRGTLHGYGPGTAAAMLLLKATVLPMSP